jgi:GNAT superfamily N-acetyltransferase
VYTGNRCLFSDNIMSFIFIQSTEYESGVICRLLSACYDDILGWELTEQFRQFDREVFENPATIGACTFITIMNSDIVGMVSYDPRQAPELGVIGHNCILPEHQKKGYGKQQVLEVIKRLKSKDIIRATVSTSEHPFFEPAHKMYLSCGFTELERKLKYPKDLYRTIYYGMELKNVCY